MMKMKEHNKIETTYLNREFGARRLILFTK